MASERWRPRVHFTPRRNWINDPNGCVYLEGEYHLFYQYNPHGKDWGHMSWGHAVSSDLLAWTELPVAIPEREFMIFSGCALVDWRNRSGLGSGARPPLLAFFTAHHEAEKRQTQCLAYSNDRGRSWTMYASNPLLDPGLEHFRDPNVFHHEPSGAWIMVVAVPRQHRVQIYRSENLRDWILTDEFGPAGFTGGQWECPVLTLVPGEDRSVEPRWVLKIDVDAGVIGASSGAQYFTGRFDGFRFQPDVLQGKPIAMLADYGGDFYAAMDWSDLPPAHDRPVWIAWMSNHLAGKAYPTHPWRGAMTLPRELFVFEEDRQFRLGQRPVPLGAAYRGGRIDLPPRTVGAGCSTRLSTIGEDEALAVELSLKTRSGGIAELRLRDGTGGEIGISWNGSTRVLTLAGGECDFRGAGPVPPRTTDPLRTGSETLHLLVILDACSVEMFLDGGRRVLTESIFPSRGLSLHLAAERRDATFEGISIRALGAARQSPL